MKNTILILIILVLIGCNNSKESNKDENNDPFVGEYFNTNWAEVEKHDIINEIYIKKDSNKYIMSYHPTLKKGLKLNEEILSRKGDTIARGDTLLMKGIGIIYVIKGDTLECLSLDYSEKYYNHSSYYIRK